jgi:hypothetical protein
MGPNKTVISIILTGLILALSSLSIQAEDMAGEAPAPDAFVRFSQQGLGLILGGSAGGGWIHFNGDDHTFRISGVSFGALGGIGETRMSGEVYGLTKLEDFPGTYSKSTAGISAVVGGGGVWLENGKGVKMHLKAESTGVGINISVGTVEVKMGMVDG